MLLVSRSEVTINLFHLGGWGGGKTHPSAQGVCVYIYIYIYIERERCIYVQGVGEQPLLGGVDPGLHVRGAATNIITTTSITRNTTSNNDSSSSSTTTTTTITSTTTSTTVIIMLFLFLDYMYEEPPAPERLHIV